MKKLCARILPPLLALLVSFVWLAEGAYSAELREIRSGKKSGFTRLVFQFEAPTLFQVNYTAATHKLSILFLEATPGPLATGRAYASPVQAIDLQPEGPHLKAVVSLSTPGYRLKTFTLTGPDRAIIDLYPPAPEASQVSLNKLVIKESVENQPADKAPDTPPEKSEPETAVAEVTQPPEADSEPAEPEMQGDPEPSAKILPAEPAPVKSPAATTAPSPSSASRVAEKEPAADIPATAPYGMFQRNLITVLAGISIVILALVIFLLLKKKNHAGKSRPVQSEQELKTTADIMASIDARIKEKFKQYEEANSE